MTEQNYGTTPAPAPQPTGLFLSREAAQKVLSYLASRPWIEVNALIGLIQNAPTGALTDQADSKSPTD